MQCKEIFKLTNFPLSSSQFRCGQGRKNDPRGKLIVQYHYIWTYELFTHLSILLKSMEWRRQHRIDTLLEEFIPPEVLTKYFPAGFVGRIKLKDPRKWHEYFDSRTHATFSKKQQHLLQFGLFVTARLTWRAFYTRSRKRTTSRTLFIWWSRASPESETIPPDTNDQTTQLSNQSSFSTWRASQCATSLTSQVYLHFPRQLWNGRYSSLCLH